MPKRKNPGLEKAHAILKERNERLKDQKPKQTSTLNISNNISSTHHSDKPRATTDNEESDAALSLLNLQNGRGPILVNNTSSSYTMRRSPPHALPCPTEFYQRGFTNNLSVTPVFLPNHVDNPPSPYTSDIVRDIEHLSVKRHEEAADIWPGIDGQTPVSPICVLSASHPPSLNARNHVNAAIRDIPERGKRKRRNVEVNGRHNLLANGNETKGPVLEISVGTAPMSTASKDNHRHSRLGPVDTSPYMDTSTNKTLQYMHDVSSKVVTSPLTTSLENPSQMYSNHFEPPLSTPSPLFQDANAFNKYSSLPMPTGRISKSPTLDAFMMIHNSRKKQKKNGSASVLRSSSQAGVEAVVPGYDQVSNDVSTLLSPEPSTPISTVVSNGNEGQRDGDDPIKRDPTTDMEKDKPEQRTSKPRNFDKVNFGTWQIKTWYHSPYPLACIDEEESTVTTGPSKNGDGYASSRVQSSKKGGNRNRSRVHTNESQPVVEEELLWVCDKCFKYHRDGTILQSHQKYHCHMNKPPGDLVYDNGLHRIYEVDGSKEKLYCQNLSLFGKFFIDIKTLFFDCENFVFYILTELAGGRDHVLGFFSKEKLSYDGYNLACIVIFPPYQRKRYGMLLIEFSYELSRRDGLFGTPERPLSELGLRSYLTFWIGALVLFFRRILTVRPTIDIKRQNEEYPIRNELIQFLSSHVASVPGKKKGKIDWETPEVDPYMSHLDSHTAQEVKKNIMNTTSGSDDALYQQMRWTQTTANPDGSATSHVFACCTLEDISKATMIRADDIAFALHECGLLQRSQELNGKKAIVISREMVEQVAKDYKVKLTCILPSSLISKGSRPG